MKLVDVVYKIFVDADGVLVDFDKEMAKIGFPNGMNTDSKTKSRFWSLVHRMAQHGFPFWRVMEKMPDADMLWAYIEKYKPEVLTAVGTVGNPEQEKREWFEEQYPNTIVHIVSKSPDKAKFAAPNHILIDDRKESINPWIAAGGIGILHISARDTIKQLQELGL